eukprot:CAMPEP_0202360052 /NCGR_PEP_ID=MMETSP1126-20121109/13130_1 /ASSEMBLY_ACC=CAM_ASM_000457 /TAXON_ID=3047 /ORGANISM="Dunaliella tertiolecta, Strain CCMP1320" /LENGTH=73 /DNA_ID=CAMNT_0048953649 /DNA_START=163 /DNA_END=380 /DNA_ORIENTATION=-
MYTSRVLCLGYCTRTPGIGKTTSSMLNLPSSASCAVTTCTAASRAADVCTCLPPSRLVTPSPFPLLAAGAGIV